MAFAVVAMVTKSIVALTPGVDPPWNTPLMSLETPDAEFLETVRSPKSVAFPIVEMVT